MKKKRSMKRFMAIFLCISMAGTCFPATVFAQSTHESAQEEIISDNFMEQMAEEIQEETTVLDEEENLIEEGAKKGEEDDISLESETEENLVSVEDQDGNTSSYTSLSEAFEAAPSNSTITVLENCEVTSGIQIKNKTITLNLNGYTITAKSENPYNLFELSEAASLTVKDTENGQIVNDSNQNRTCVILLDDASQFFMEEGSIRGFEYGIKCNTSAHITITGGTVTQCKAALSVCAATNVLFTGGSLEGNSSNDVETADGYSVNFVLGGTAIIGGMDVKEGFIFIQSDFIGNVTFRPKHENMVVAKLGNANVEQYIKSEGLNKDIYACTDEDIYYVVYSNDIGGIRVSKDGKVKTINSTNESKKNLIDSAQNDDYIRIIGDYLRINTSIKNKRITIHFDSETRGNDKNVVRLRLEENATVIIRNLIVDASEGIFIINKRYIGFDLTAATSHLILENCSIRDYKTGIRMTAPGTVDLYNTQIGYCAGGIHVWDSAKEGVIGLYGTTQIRGNNNNIYGEIKYYISEDFQGNVGLSYPIWNHVYSINEYTNPKAQYFNEDDQKNGHFYDLPQLNGGYKLFRGDIYSIQYETNGGTINSGNIDKYGATIGAELTQDVTREGYKFLGWCLKADCSDTPAFNISAAQKGNVILYAKWIPLGQVYSVILNTNGGIIQSGNIDSYVSGQSVVLPTDIVRDRYEFKGWYRDADCTDGPVTEISDTESGNKTYYAKWLNLKPISVTEADGKRSFYASLSEAFDAAPSNSTITVLENYEVTSGIEIKNKAITLNLDEYTITATSENVYNLFELSEGASLTIKAIDKGQIVNGVGQSRTCVALLDDASQVLLESGSILAFNQGIRCNTAAHFTMTGGSISKCNVGIVISSETNVLFTGGRLEDNSSNDVETVDQYSTNFVLGGTAFIAGMDIKEGFIFIQSDFTGNATLRPKHENMVIAKLEKANVEKYIKSEGVSKNKEVYSCTDEEVYLAVSRADLVRVSKEGKLASGSMNDFQKFLNSAQDDDYLRCFGNKIQSTLNVNNKRITIHFMGNCNPKSGFLWIEKNATVTIKNLSSNGGGAFGRRDSYICFGLSTPTSHLILDNCSLKKFKTGIRMTGSGKVDLYNSTITDCDKGIDVYDSAKEVEIGLYGTTKIRGNSYNVTKNAKKLYISDDFQGNVGLSYPTWNHIYSINEYTNPKAQYLSEDDQKNGHFYDLPQLNGKYKLFRGTVYNIQYVTNGGTINSGYIDKYGATIGTDLTQDVTRKGYQFLGWCLKPDCSDTPAFTISTKQTGTVRLYAKWKKLGQVSPFTLNINRKTIQNGKLDPYIFRKSTTVSKLSPI